MAFQHPWADNPGFYVDESGQQRILIDEIEILPPTPEQEGEGVIIAAIKHVGVKEPGVLCFSSDEFSQFVDLFKSQDGWLKTVHYRDGQACTFIDCKYTGPWGNRACPGCGRVGARGEVDVKCYY